jgi:hypothetical protein
VIARQRAPRLYWWLNRVIPGRRRTRIDDLHWALLRQDMKDVHALLRVGADPNGPFSGPQSHDTLASLSPLGTALVGYREAIPLLLAFGARADRGENDRTDCPMVVAARGGMVDEVILFHKQDCSLRADQLGWKLETAPSNRKAIPDLLRENASTEAFRIWMHYFAGFEQERIDVAIARIQPGPSRIEALPGEPVARPRKRL